MDHNGWPFDYDSALQVIRAQTKRIEELEEYERQVIDMKCGFRALSHILKAIEISQ
jgi:hypothetical protein